MMIGCLEVEKMLYDDDDSGFIATSPYPGHSGVQLREKEFRMFFGKNYTVDTWDRCRIKTIYNGVEFFAMTDIPE